MSRDCQPHQLRPACHARMTTRWQLNQHQLRRDGAPCHTRKHVWGQRRTSKAMFKVTSSFVRATSVPLHAPDASPERSLERLDSLPEASFDAANKQHVVTCLPNTRRDVLAQVKRWADGDGGQRIYWLKGWAGMDWLLQRQASTRGWAEKRRLARLPVDRPSESCGSAIGRMAARYSLFRARQLVQSHREM